MINSIDWAAVADWLNGAFVLALLGIVALVLRMRAEAKAARTTAESKLHAIQHQVQNSHGTNLRDDLDQTNRSMAALQVTVDGIASQLDGMAHRQDELARDVGGLRSDSRQLRKDFSGMLDDNREAEKEHRSIWAAIRDTMRPDS